MRTKWLAIGGASAAAAVAVTLAIVLVARSSGGGAPPSEHTQLLRQLGEAWALDFGTKLAGVETRVSATVDASNRADQAARLKKALALGCVGRGEAFRSVPLEQAQDAFTFRMSDDKSPAEHADALVEPGHVIVEAAWRFGPSPPVTTVAVFTSDGYLLFDSMLSFPALPEPLLFPRHF